MGAFRICCLLGLILSLGAVEQVVLPEGSAANHTTLGNTALRNRQYDSAIAHYRKALEVDRSYFYALFNLGLAFQERAAQARDPDERQGLLLEAVAHYERALRQRPDHAEVHCNLGFIAFEQGEYQLAVQRFQAAQEKASRSERSAEYAYNRGTALERLGEWGRARSAYEHCLELNGEHFAARYNLGSLLFRRLDEPALARRQLRQAHEIDPRRPEPLINLAILLGGQDPVEAERLLDRAAAAAAEHHPQLLNEVRWRRALFYWNHSLPGKTTKVLAKDDLLRILADDPDHAGANGLLGQYYESIAQYEKAITHLEREVAEDRFDPGSEIDLQAHYLLAIIYSEHRKDAAKALLHATRYYELRPDGTSEALRLRAQRVLEDTDVRP